LIVRGGKAATRRTSLGIALKKKKEHPVSSRKRKVGEAGELKRKRERT